ncbi:MAG: DUF1573 domain-containing protein [Bacteroidia bacterium]
MINLYIILLSIFQHHSTQVKSDFSEEGPRIVFENTRLTSDTLCEGEKYDFKYKMYNKGNMPLVLTNVRSSCGCYVPTWPRAPLPPGDSAYIIGRYDSRGRPGAFSKSMTINSNDLINPTAILICRGVTLPRDQCQN